MSLDRFSNNMRIRELLERFEVHAIRQGGRLLAGARCSSERVPDLETGRPEDAVWTCGCGNEAKWLLPATGLKDEDPVIVCAFCDLAHQFPRYSGGEAVTA